MDPDGALNPVSAKGCPSILIFLSFFLSIYLSISIYYNRSPLAVWSQTAPWTPLARTAVRRRLRTPPPRSRAGRPPAGPRRCCRRRRNSRAAAASQRAFCGRDFAVDPRAAQKRSGTQEVRLTHKHTHTQHNTQDKTRQHTRVNPRSTHTHKHTHNITHKTRQDNTYTQTHIYLADQALRQTRALHEKPQVKYIYYICVFILYIRTQTHTSWRAMSATLHDPEHTHTI